MQYLLLSFLFAINTVQTNNINNSTENELTKNRFNIEFCQLTIDEVYKIGNFTSSIIYTFKLDEEGHPIEICDLKDTFVGKQKVVECLNNWRITGIKDGGKEKITMIYTWKHAVGWYQLTIVGSSFNFTVKLPEPISQYVPQK